MAAALLGGAKGLSSLMEAACAVLDPIACARAPSLSDVDVAQLCEVATTVADYLYTNHFDSVRRRQAAAEAASFDDSLTLDEAHLASNTQVALTASFASLPSRYVLSALYISYGMIGVDDFTAAARGPLAAILAARSLPCDAAVVARSIDGIAELLPEQVLQRVGVRWASHRFGLPLARMAARTAATLSATHGVGAPRLVALFECEVDGSDDRLLGDHRANSSSPSDRLWNGWLMHLASRVSLRVADLPASGVLDPRLFSSAGFEGGSEGVLVLHCGGTRGYPTSAVQLALSAAGHAMNTWVILLCPGSVRSLPVGCLDPRYVSLLGPDYRSSTQAPEVPVSRTLLRHMALSALLPNTTAWHDSVTAMRSSAETSATTARNELFETCIAASARGGGAPSTAVRAAARQVLAAASSDDRWALDALEPVLALTAPSVVDELVDAAASFEIVVAALGSARGSSQQQEVPPVDHLLQETAAFATAERMPGSTTILARPTPSFGENDPTTTNAAAVSAVELGASRQAVRLGAVLADHLWANATPTKAGASDRLVNLVVVIRRLSEGGQIPSDTFADAAIAAAVDRLRREELLPQEADEVELTERFDHLVMSLRAQAYAVTHAPEVPPTPDHSVPSSEVVGLSDEENRLRLEQEWKSSFEEFREYRRRRLETCRRFPTETQPAARVFQLSVLLTLDRNQEEGSTAPLADPSALALYVKDIDGALNTLEAAISESYALEAASTNQFMSSWATAAAQSLAACRRLWGGADHSQPAAILQMRPAVETAVRRAEWLCSVCPHGVGCATQPLHAAYVRLASVVLPSDWSSSAATDVLK